MFNYSVNVVNTSAFGSAVSSYISSIQATTEAALADWGRYLGGSGTINVRVEISDDLGFGTLAAAGPTSVFQLSSNVYEAGSLHELRTGTDLNGSTEDIIVYIDSFTLATGQYYFGSAAPPVSQFDALTVLRHEIGHGLGFIAFLDTAEQQQRGDDRFTFDTNVSFASGLPRYVGTTAVLYNGGPIDLIPGGPSHIASGTFTDKEKQGPGREGMYRARVSLGPTSLRELSASFRLIPGMTVTAEIKAGERTVMSYFLYPLLRGLDESIREP